MPLIRMVCSTIRTRMATAPHFPTLQAVNSPTFTIPPAYLAGRMSFPELWDHHLDFSPHHPLFVYERSPGLVATITWSQAVKSTHRAAHIIQPSLRSVSNRRPVVGVLAFPGEYYSLSASEGNIERCLWQMFRRHGLSSQLSCGLTL